MKFFGINIFPLILILGSLYLILKEWAYYRYFKKTSRNDYHAKARMVRRIFGAILVIIISFMLHYGLLYFSTPTKDTYYKLLNYWIIVIILVFFAVGLAFWDIYEGVKNLEKIIDQTSNESVEEIKENLSKTVSGEGKFNKNDSL